MDLAMTSLSSCEVLIVLGITDSLTLFITVPNNVER